MLWIDDAPFSSSYCSYLLYIFLQVGKIKVTAKGVLKILRIHSQNFAIIMTNGIRKVRQGVDIFNKRNLDSCKFISDNTSEYRLIYSNFFPHSRQSINRYHSAWCTIYQDSTFYVSIFLVSGKREGKEKYRVTPPSLHYYFLSFFQVGCTSLYCHVLFHTGFFSDAKKWRELIKNLTVLKLPGCLYIHRTKFNRKN